MGALDGQHWRMSTCNAPLSEIPLHLVGFAAANQERSVRTGASTHPSGMGESSRLAESWAKVSDPSCCPGGDPPDDEGQESQTRHVAPTSS